LNRKLLKKTKYPPALSPLNHPNKLVPNRLGAHKHASEVYAHPSTIIFRLQTFKFKETNTLEKIIKKQKKFWVAGLIKF
jgi:hypothetical protein